MRRYLAHLDPALDPEKAAEAYHAFPPGFPPPPPLVTVSASPGILELQNRQLAHFRGLERPDAEFFAVLRYILADRHDSPDCLHFNAELLKRAAGYAEEELDALLREPENAPLDEAQNALLLFVLDLARDPGAVRETDIEDLRALGFSDQDLMHAAFHATSFISAITLHKAFCAKPDEEA